MRHEIRCWRIPEWPLEDQRLWIENCKAGDPFDDPHYAPTLRSATRDKTAKGYGRWLCFLASNGWLDKSGPPLDRVTRPRLRRYFQELRAAGNADHTIIGRFDELCRAMRILAPHRDSSWIRKPTGVTIYSLLEKNRRTVLVPDAEVLLAWGYSMMDQANTKTRRRDQLIAFRDGLLLTLLASCGRRLRSISLLRLGRELVRGTVCYRIELCPDQVKTNRADCFDLQPELTPYIDRYINDVRPALLGDARYAALWISARGGIWTAKAIQNQVLAHSRARFGTAFGPHRFRHAIASTAPHLDPSNPLLAAELLGISRETVQESYNRAGSARAATAYEKCLARRIAAIRHGNCRSKPAPEHGP
jgi:site-specific recombinase XerD